MNEDIQNFYDEQFRVWPELKESYAALGRTERRLLHIDGFPVFLQHNPARVKSTGAAVDAKSVAARPCFLCAANRPEQQIAGGMIEGWQILANPYPIFPVHFTIVSMKHEPQQALPILPMVELVDAIPDLVAFFNGAKAGASAPDHLHFQAVMKDELHLLKMVEEEHTIGSPRTMESEKMSRKFPFRFTSRIVTPDMEGMEMLKALSEQDSPLVNNFVWKDAYGYLRVLTFPRRAHRPKCYDAEGEERMMVSPGAIDMAGIVILPRKEDFERIDEESLRRIYSEVS